jgi:hypothetical protein
LSQLFNGQGILPRKDLEMEDEIVVHVQVVAHLNLRGARRVQSRETGEEVLELSLPHTQAEVEVLTDWGRQAVRRLNLQEKVGVQLPLQEALNIRDRIEVLAEKLRRG